MSNNTSEPVYRLDAAPLVRYLNSQVDFSLLPFPGRHREEFVPTPSQLKRGLTQRDVWVNRLTALMAKMVANGYVSHLTADVICIDYLGLHPMEVFGEGWFEIDDEKSPLLIANKDWSKAA